MSVSYVHPPVLASYLETPLPEFTYSTNKNINIVLALTESPFLYIVHAMYMPYSNQIASGACQ